MKFGQAVEAAQAGERVTRVGWNGKGMFVFQVSSWTFTDGKNDNFANLPFLAMKTAQGNVVPWLASHTDVLAEDWQLATPNE